MEVTETSSEGLKHEFKVVVPAQRIAEQLDSRLQEIGGTVTIPGFRPGKAPIAILKQRFSASVLGEVVEKAITDSSEQAMSERNLRPALQPKIEITAFAEGTNLEYTMAVEALPEIEPVDFSKLELERMVVEVPGGEVDRALERLAQNFGETEPIEVPRKTVSGDIVVIDFTGRIDGEEFAGGSATDYYLELGSDQMIPGFEAQLIGVDSGQQVTVNVDFPADHASEDLAGKATAFDVTVKEIRQKVTATLDDALAQKIGHENIDSLRKAIREQIENDYKALSRAHLKRALLDKLADLYTFDLPPGMVDMEFDSIWERVQEDKKKGELDEEDAGKSDEELKTDYRTISERRVRLGLLLSEVGRQNNIAVAQEELSRAVLEETRRHPGHEREIMEFYKSSPAAMANLQAPIYEDKVVDFVVEMATVTDRTVSPQDLLQPPGDSGAREAEAATDDPAGESRTSEKNS